MLRILNYFSSCGDVNMLLPGDSVVQHYVFSLHPRSYNESLYDFLKVSLGGVRAFSGVRFSASVSLGGTFFVAQKVRA